MEKFYGKYRGAVINNVDPMQKARLQVQVPDVLGLGVSSWAMPCVPVTGRQSGTFVLPAINAGVWVEFEGGNPDFPIWTGGYWAEGELPALAMASNPASPSIVLQTMGQNTLSLSDVPGAGGILLKSTTGAFISIGETGIIISNGQGAMITMNGPTVTVNQGALTIV